MYSDRDVILLLYKTSFLSKECQLSIGELSTGEPLADIDINIPLPAQIVLYSLDVYWNP